MNDRVIRLRALEAVMWAVTLSALAGCGSRSSLAVDPPVSDDAGAAAACLDDAGEDPCACGPLVWTVGGAEDSVWWADPHQGGLLLLTGEPWVTDAPFELRSLSVRGDLRTALPLPRDLSGGFPSTNYPAPGQDHIWAVWYTVPATRPTERAWVLVSLSPDEVEVLDHPSGLREGMGQCWTFRGDAALVHEYARTDDADPAAERFFMMSRGADGSWTVDVEVGVPPALRGACVVQGLPGVPTRAPGRWLIPQMSRYWADEPARWRVWRLEGEEIELAADVDLARHGIGRDRRFNGESEILISHFRRSAPTGDGVQTILHVTRGGRREVIMLGYVPGEEPTITTVGVLASRVDAVTRVFLHTDWDTGLTAAAYLAYLEDGGPENLVVVVFDGDRREVARRRIHLPAGQGRLHDLQVSLNGRHVLATVWRTPFSDLPSSYNVVSFCF